MNETAIANFAHHESYLGVYLTPSQLQRGHVYLAKDGRIMLYLGISSLGTYIFYIITSCYIYHIYDDDRTIRIMIGNYGCQAPAIREAVEMTMSRSGDARLILEQKKGPNILGEFPCKDYENTFRTWYHNSFAGMEVPDIDARSVNSAYVSVKDLCPGEIYYTGNGSYGNLFVYLGRSTGNKFLWYRVDAVVTVLDANMDTMLNRSRYTVANKKVKPLCKIMEDTNAVQTHLAQELLEKCPRIDMSGVNQHMLDAAAGEEE